MPRTAVFGIFEKRCFDGAESLFDVAHRPIESCRHVRFRPDDGPLPSSTSNPDHRPWQGKALKSASTVIGAILWAAAVPSSRRAEILALSLHPSQRLPPGRTTTEAAR